ncbi:hypothetical protein [Secundilactobacillus silagei]|uniref:hypothetical protein n=1 Tax=Secundilactobacillus silagei TaxID=1293415 RepID=UPI00209271EB|nr:hypothetical protein [Secundilactobacillus silagei]
MAGMPLYQGEQQNNWRTILNTPLFNAYTLNIKTSRGKTTYNQLGINNLSDYEPKDHLLINLGYSNNLRKTINLSFTGAESCILNTLRSLPCLMAAVIVSKLPACSTLV